MADKSKRIVFGQGSGKRGLSGSGKQSSRRIIGESEPKPPPDDEAGGPQEGEDASSTPSRPLQPSRDELRPDREDALRPTEDRLVRAEASRNRLRAVRAGADSDGPPARRPVARTPEEAERRAPRRDMVDDPFRWPRRAGLIASLALGVFMTYCYTSRPNELAAITVFPAWVWAVPGLVLLAPAWLKHARWLALVMTVLWIAYSAAFMDGLSSFVRGTYTTWPTQEWLAARSQGLAIRVVSLNCKGHSLESAKEVRQYDPDIVLLQEAPRFDAVKVLALDLYGSTAGIAYGYDAAIIARGVVKQREFDKDFRRFIAQAEVTLLNGVKVDVVSLRLVPAHVRIDLWNPEAWQMQKQNREVRIGQIQSVADLLSKDPSTRPMILGGDFNATQGDPVYSYVPRRLRDAFDVAGLGWGGTYSNQAPLLRVDHVFTTRDFRPTAVVARNTLHTDHLILVCDLILKGGRARTPGTVSELSGDPSPKRDKPLFVGGKPKRRPEPPPVASPRRRHGAGGTPRRHAPPPAPAGPKTPQPAENYEE